MARDPFCPHVEGLEARFAHDTTRQFLARSRATRDVALWAAHQAGQDPEHAERYARTLVAQSVAMPAIESIARRICRDLHEAQAEIDQTEVEGRLRARTAQAWTEI